MTKDQQMKSGKVLPFPRSPKNTLSEKQFCARDAIVTQHIVVILKDMFQALRTRNASEG